jgi:hypothetical protein
MKTMVPNKIYYRHSSIRSIGALAKALGIPANHLLEIAARANQLYQRPKKPTIKADGSIRDVWCVQKPLRVIQDAILKNILSGLHFPNYITGSIKRCDYKANAEPHAGSAIIITEDIVDFFPSTTYTSVYEIWKHVFGFANDVSHCLAALTTKTGCIPQGAPTSSYLANTIFWKEEPRFSDWAFARDLTYTRYVDDLTISSSKPISAVEKKEIVTELHKLVNRVGLRLKRIKHQISTKNIPMTVTKLQVNGQKPTLGISERARIRAATLDCEMSAEGVQDAGNLTKKINSVSGRVGKLGRFHPREAAKLKARLKLVRGAISSRSQPTANKRLT